MKRVRLRADPAKIRICVRHLENGLWQVELTTRSDPSARVLRRANTPREALVRVLRVAEMYGFDGIDLGMDWAYPHPHVPA